MEWSEFSNPVGLLPMKLQLLKISMLGRMTPQGHMTSETYIDHYLGTERERAKRSKCLNCVGLIPTKLQLLKILILGSHEPSR